jgi:hypothetical protein
VLMRILVRINEAEPPHVTVARRIAPL